MLWLRTGIPRAMHGGCPDPELRSGRALRVSAIQWMSRKAIRTFLRGPKPGSGAVSVVATLPEKK